MRRRFAAVILSAGTFLILAVFSSIVVGVDERLSRITDTPPKGLIVR